MRFSWLAGQPCRVTVVFDAVFVPAAAAFWQGASLGFGVAFAPTLAVVLPSLYFGERRQGAA